LRRTGAPSTDLDDSRTSNHGIVVDSLVAVRKQQVRLPIDTLRHSDLVTLPIARWLQQRPVRTRHGNERSVNMRIRIRSRESVASSLHANRHAGRDSARRRNGETRECLHGKRRVIGRAGHNEAVRERVHLIRCQRVVVRLRERALGQGGAEVGAMPRFDGEDAAGGRQVGFSGDLRGGAEVGGGAHAFQDAGCGYELGNACDAEGVGALFGWGRAYCVQRGGEEGDVPGFVRADGLHVLVEGAVVAGGGEGGLGEVGLQICLVREVRCQRMGSE